MIKYYFKNNEAQFDKCRITHLSSFKVHGYNLKCSLLTVTFKVKCFKCAQFQLCYKFEIVNIFNTLQTWTYHLGQKWVRNHSESVLRVWKHYFNFTLLCIIFLSILQYVRNKHCFQKYAKCAYFTQGYTHFNKGFKLFIYFKM